MALYKPDPIFKGKTPGGVRAALKEILNCVDNGAKINKFIMPCAGTFGMIETMAGFGVDPKIIEGSDITLYSGVLGYLVDPMKCITDLGFKVSQDSRLNMMGIEHKDFTEVEQAAWILYCIKFTQLIGNSEFLRSQGREFTSQFNHVFDSYCKTLLKFKAALGGMTYISGDGHEHARAHLEDKGTVIWYDPPAYSGGYTKMFESHGHWDWDAPSVPEIKPGDCPEFMAEVQGKPVMVLANFNAWCDYMPGKQLFPGWHTVYVEKVKHSKDKTFVVCNKKITHSLARPSKVGEFPAKIHPIYDEHEITEKSDVRLVEVKKEIGLYYYDLFVRELGMTAAELYYVLTIDGQVAGTAGFMVNQIHQKREPVLFQVFGLTMTSLRYKRLNRLLVGSMITREFIDEFQAKYLADKLATRVKVIRTTYISKYAELKTNRGLMKLRTKKKMPNGRYHLSYQADVKEETYAEMLGKWVGKHAKHSREEWESKDAEGSKVEKATA